MKGVTLRLNAELSTDASFTSRALYYSLKLFNIVFTLRQRLVGQWRLWLNYCPECNSCAPKLHNCDVCSANTKAYFTWNEEIRNNWWRRFAHKHRIAL